MSDITVLTAAARERVGKGSAREARRQGKIPAVIYGDKKSPASITLERKLLVRHLESGGFFNTLFDIELDGKLNRVLHHFARRPQVQERLTMQVADMLSETLQTDDVAVILEARHLCVEMRGVRDRGAETSTMVLRGRFEKELKEDFFRQLN